MWNRLCLLFIVSLLTTPSLLLANDNMSTEAVFETSFEYSSEAKIQHCVSFTNNSTVPWICQDYDNDGVLNGVDPCPSLENITYCGMDYDYVPTYILHNQNILLDTDMDYFLSYSKFCSKCGDLILFEVESDLYIHQQAHLDYVYSSRSSSMYTGEFGTKYFNSIIDFNGPSCDIDEYITPDGRYFICYKDNFSPFATNPPPNDKIIVDLSNNTVNVYDENHLVESETGFVDPSFNISTNSVRGLNHFTENHWLFSSYVGSGPLVVNWNGNNSSKYNPNYTITSMSLSDSRDSILILDESEGQGSQPITDNFELKIWNFVENTTYYLPLTGFESSINHAYSVDVSLDGSTILFIRTYEHSEEPHNKLFGMIQIYERDMDDDGVADRFDEYPLDPTRHKLESVVDLDSDLFFEVLFTTLIAIFLLYMFFKWEVPVTSENSYSPTPKSSERNKLKCRVCKTILPAKSVGERVVRGTAGAGVGTTTGAVLGTIFLPGIGTVIGAGVGAWSGTISGSMQNSDICNNCCALCSNKKSNCICNDIIGLCRQCGKNITYSNSSSGYCYSCRDSWYGDDL